MEVADTTGKTILKGSHVRYTGTGSAGEVLDVKSDDEGTWAKIDTTDLWYNSVFGAHQPAGLRTNQAQGKTVQRKC